MDYIYSQYLEALAKNGGSETMTSQKGNLEKGNLDFSEVV